MTSKKENANLAVIGIDVGFGYTKVFPGNHIFPSITTEFRDRIMSFGNSNPMDNLILEVDGKSYLIGNLAKKEGGSSTFDQDNHMRHKLCMLTSIALSAGGDFSGIVVMGLPISDLQKKKRDVSLLKGTYDIKLSGKEYHIDISKVLVAPQGAAGYFDLILSDEGKVVSSLAEKRIGIIDIGEKTLDFVAMESSQFIMEKSGGLDMGMHRAYLRILKTIQTDLGISVMPYQVRDYMPKVPASSEKELRLLSQEIVDGITPWWNYRDFDSIYLAGGGGEALFRFISERIKCETIPEGQFSNARGYYKCGKASQ